MGLAYEIALCARGDTRELPPVLKKLEKSKNTALLLKSFTLERSVTKINVMQARNYLKKPYMKPNKSMSVLSSTQKSETKKHRPLEIDFIDEIDNAGDIFMEKAAPKTKKIQVKKYSSFKLHQTRNSFNSGFSNSHISSSDLLSD